MNEQFDAIFNQVMDEACENPLYRFAELVSIYAVAKEREACAKVCESLLTYWGNNTFAVAIRKRTE